MRSRRIIHLTAVTALAVTGGGLLAAAPAGAEKPMTRAEAARHYTQAVCPANAVQAEYRAVVARARAAGTPLDVGSPLPADVGEAARRTAEATARSGKVLRNPPAAWPASVLPNVEIAIAYNAQLVGYYRTIAGAAAVPETAPLVTAMTEVQRINLPLLRAALGVDPTDPCAATTPTTTIGRRAAPAVLDTVTVGPQGTGPGAMFPAG